MTSLAFSMPSAPAYGFGARLGGISLEAARARVVEALAAEGFGVLYEINLRAALRRKLGVDVSPYLVLAVWNPALTYRALLTEPNAGAVLPANVALWQEGDQIFVTATNPEAVVGLIGDARLEPVAAEAAARLHDAIERLRAR